MFRKNLLVFGVVTMLVQCFSAQAIAADNCEKLSKNVLFVVGNGYGGSSGGFNGLSLTKQPDGTYVFDGSLTMTNEATDKLHGTCKDRHIKFTRTRTGVSIQTYDGWLFEKQYEGHSEQEMAGTITSGGATKWGWYGWIGQPPPK